MDNNLLLGTLMSGPPGTAGALLATQAQVAGGMPGEQLMMQLPPGQIAENPEESFFSLLMAEGGNVLNDGTEPVVSPLFAAIQQEFVRAEAGRGNSAVSGDTAGKPLPPTAAALPPGSSNMAARMPLAAGEIEASAIERNRIIAMQIRTDVRAEPGVQTVAAAAVPEAESVPDGLRAATLVPQLAEAMQAQRPAANRSAGRGASGNGAPGAGGALPVGGAGQRAEPMTFDSAVLPPDDAAMPQLVPGATAPPDGVVAQAASVAVGSRAGSGFAAKSAEAPPEQELIEVTDGIEFGTDLKHSIGAFERPAASTAMSGLGRAVGAPQWAEALAGRVRYLVGQNMQRAEIRLDPPELGALEVRISLAEGGAQVHFGAENAAARDALEAALPRLRELMSQSGFSEVQVDVGDRQPQEQQLAGDGGEERDGGQGAARSESDVAPDADSVGVSTARPASGGERVFDAYA